MESASQLGLVFLGIVLFLNLRNGTLPQWLRAKFFNAAAPATKKSAAAGASSVFPGVMGILTSSPSSSTATGAAIGASGWVNPLPGGQVNQPYKGAAHPGVDLGYPGAYGADVLAAAAGTVTFAGASGGYGLRIDVDHGAGQTTRYGHLSAIGVSVGEHVNAGQSIGNVGNTGESTGPHLHFEVATNGVTTDPCSVIPGACTAVGA